MVLRFGIICEGMFLKAWQHRSILRLMELERVELSLIITNDKKTNPSRRDLFHSFYRRIQKRFQSKQLVEISNLFPNIPKQALSEGISQLDLDFVIDFTRDSFTQEQLDMPKYGIWTFSHGDTYKGGPSCFWEIYNGNSITTASLRRILNESGETAVLQKGYFSTIPYSYSKNVDRACFISAEWPAKVCKDILHGNSQYFDEIAPASDFELTKMPSNLQMIIFILKTSFHFMKMTWKYFFMLDEWNVGIINKPIHTVLNGEIEPEFLPKPKLGTFFADSFGMVHNGKKVVMVEEWPLSGVGHISAIEMNGTDQMAKTTVIKLPTHLSYPYLIEYKGEVYCIPESYQSRKVTLYKAIDFPTKWDEAMTLIDDFAAVDSTVFQFDGLWWLMCTNKDVDSNSALYIWYAEDLFGPWKQHKANPVKVDVRSSRPGGTPFVHNGALYRPAQNSTLTYGGSIVINKITKLTIDYFREETVTEIEPNFNGPYNKGIHTIASMGDQTLIDGKRLVFAPTSVVQRLRNR